MAHRLLAVVATVEDSVEVRGELGKLPGKPDPRGTINWAAGS